MNWGIKKSVVAGCVTVLLVITAVLAGVSVRNYGGSSYEESELKTFNSLWEIQKYIETDHSVDTDEESWNAFPLIQRDTDVKVSNAPAELSASSGASDDYSTTNVQVLGVDEGDIVKNDGEYAYVISNDNTKVHIIDVYPAKNSKMVSTIETELYIQEIYLNGDKLLILGLNQSSYSKIVIQIYNIKVKSYPVLTKETELTGRYLSSRMIDEYFYVIANQYVNRIKTLDDLPAPPQEIYYVPNTTDNSFCFTSIMSVNINDKLHEPETMIILMGSSNQIYVSTKNIYITLRKYEQTKVIENTGFLIPISREIDVNSNTEMTLIFRLSINDGAVKYKAAGTVPGRVLNRFSMDEHKEYFRIATTTGHVSKSDSSVINEVYVLNMNMEIVGELSNIAPGEQIYSARFMGDRGYLVTFKKVDPFFVIDLKYPRYPKILGELKIPGYSNYLHPYDENHVIGIGKDTVEAGGGSFAWYQGVKLSLFDVRNVKKPKELSKYIIGDRGTDSDALSDPHAFLFSKAKNLLVIPIILAEINESKYPNGASDNTRGEYTYCGAYVFDISTNQGIKLKGRITHEESNSNSNNNRYYWNQKDKIKRSFYIEQNLYTVSGTKLKANNLNDLTEIKTIDLP